MYNKNLPEGTRDILYDEASLQNKIASRFSTVYEQEGFLPINTPTLEFYDVFDGAGKSMKQEEMFTLTDNYGRLLVLRADNTTPTARVIATKLRSAPVPLKLYYNQSVFRNNTDYQGRRSEFLQSGVELAGINGTRTDIICISTAFKALNTLNKKYMIEIGHVGFSNAIIEDLVLSDADKAQVQAYINTKNASLLGYLKTKEDIFKIRQLPWLYGGAEVLEKAAFLAEGNEKAQRALKSIAAIYESLRKAGYEENIIIDLGMAHAIEYYTGIVFRGYMEGTGDAVLTGGRYDNLIKSFDYDIPAIGFAINVCAVVDAVGKGADTLKSKAKKVLVFFEPTYLKEAETYMRKLKDEGYVPELSCFANEKETLAFAKANGYGFIGYVKGEKPYMAPVGGVV